MPPDIRQDTTPPEPPRWRRHATAYLVAIVAAVLLVALLIASDAIFKG